ncbi:MAG TPA: type VI secretion system baseplate subunit TssG [Polyangiaceae bacterium]|nr:type VI secretion system baseplate subunit TssG [Polyangiaceae bacterium]
MSRRVAGEERRFCELVRRLAPRSPHAPDQALERLDEQLHFRADVGYANPGREVVSIVRASAGAAGASASSRGGPGERIELYVNRYVLAGLHGPLPEPYQELAARRAAAGDHATCAFLDLFNHRINLLRFWLLARHEPGLSAVEPAQSPLVRLAAALAEGSVPASEANAQRSGAGASGCPLPAQSVLGLAALLRHPQRSADVVQAVLRRVLGQRLEVLPFRGGWLPRSSVPDSRLGNARLGRSSILGTRVWDPGRGIELRLFPSTTPAFAALLPGGGRHDQLCRLVRWVTQRRVDVHVVCCPPEAAVARLARARERAPRLGYTAHLSPGAVPGGPVRFSIFAEESAGGVGS